MWTHQLLLIWGCGLFCFYANNVSQRFIKNVPETVLFINYWQIKTLLSCYQLEVQSVISKLQLNYSRSRFTVLISKAGTHTDHYSVLLSNRLEYFTRAPAFTSKVSPVVRFISSSSTSIHLRLRITMIISSKAGFWWGSPQWGGAIIWADLHFSVWVAAGSKCSSISLLSVVGHQNGLSVYNTFIIYK